MSCCCDTPAGSGLEPARVLGAGAVFRLAAINLLLWGGAALGATAIGDALRTPLEVPDSSGPHAGPFNPPQPPPTIDAAFIPPPASVFAPIAARPLFTPTRRPPPVAAEATAPEAADPPTLALVGVLMRDGAPALALMRDAEGATLRLGPGATHDGWTVAEIAPRAVTLRREGVAHVAALGAASEGAAPGGGVAAAAKPSDPAHRAAEAARRAAAAAPDPFAAPEDQYHDDHD